ncbi:hypothetical protein GCM10007301_02320 [Azorhizobium oxalatiphilum]|uniref:Extensin-like C-terminal domain-containing protein n=1 Tax=Azorhizobium oxalatiphilum TaxID=980631 RepID=A0A917BJV2_9HYPH|nr:extensin family protein [Azorhizobium oxalatiphilum]GGF46343.1 hypothetical protein GCM10007301_02320 [Azorhizobium oxalatiphilum]
MRARRGLALAAAVLVAGGGFLGAGGGPLSIAPAQAQSLPWPFNTPAKPRPKKRVPAAQKPGAAPVPAPAPGRMAQDVPLPLPRPRTLGAVAGAAAGTAKTESAKAAVSAPTPIAPVSPARPDAGAPAASKAEAAKPRDGQTDAPKADAAKTDSGKTEAGKADTGKTDPGKTDAGKTETAKTDADTPPAAPLPPARPPRDLVAEAPAPPPVMEGAYAACLAEFARRGGEVEQQAEMPAPEPEKVSAAQPERSTAQHVFAKETDRSSPSATAANVAKETATADFAPPPEPTTQPEPGSAAQPTEKPAERIVASLQAKGQPAACAIPGPLTFRTINVPDAPAVTLEGAVTVRCTMALELAGWIRDDLSAIAKRHGSTLAKVTGVGGHACRPRNNRPGGQVSEHASGNAFDLLGLKFTDGRLIELWKDDPATKEIREEVKKSACARFHTVLGPGADSAHANHVHVDLRERRSDFRMCQWNVK